MEKRPNRCVYVDLPLSQNQNVVGDTRVFQVGEPVCLRNQHPTIPERGIYRVAQPQPGTGRVFLHRVNSPGLPDRWVGWEDVGKIVYGAPPTLVRKVMENKNMPENIERLVRLYGGRSRKIQTRRRARKSRKHGKTRKHH